MHSAWPPFAPLNPEHPVGGLTPRLLTSGLHLFRPQPPPPNPGDHGIGGLTGRPFNQLDQTVLDVIPTGELKQYSNVYCNEQK